MNLLFIASLFLAVVGAGLGYAIGVGKALLLLAVVAAVAAVVALANGGTSASGAAMIIAFGLPFLAVPAALGALAGSELRSGRRLASGILVVIAAALLSAFAMKKS